MKRKSLFFSALVFAVFANVVLLSPSAHATRARLIALGQDPDGSLYLDDARNMFTNPAALNFYAPMANFEFGRSARTYAAAADPNGEGGLAMSQGDLKYAVQLGRGGYITQLTNLFNAATAGDTFYTPENGFEVIVGGKGQISWGGSIAFVSSDTSTANSKGSGLEARAGIANDQFHGFARMSLLASSSKDVAGATNSITGKPSFDAGGAFNVGAKSKIWGLARVNWFGLKVGGGDDRDGSRYALAAGFTQFVNPETITKLFWSAGLAMDNIAVKAGNNLAEAKVESLTLPLILGLEHQLTDMWALRASVRQNVLVGQTKIAVGGGADFNGNNSPNSTTLAAGLGMKWKKLELDGTFAGATTGALNAATLLAQMGLMYSF